MKELTVKEIVKILEDNKIEAEDIDETIHQAASALASCANNDGLEAQVTFLNNTCGWDTKDILSNTMDINVANMILSNL
jgi:hypothetical protein